MTVFVCGWFKVPWLKAIECFLYFFVFTQQESNRSVPVQYWTFYRNVRRYFKSVDYCSHSLFDSNEMCCVIEERCLCMLLVYWHNVIWHLVEWWCINTDKLVSLICDYSESWRWFKPHTDVRINCFLASYVCLHYNSSNCSVQLLGSWPLNSSVGRKDSPMPLSPILYLQGFHISGQQQGSDLWNGLI